MQDRVLILAPRGRDAAIAADLLARNAIAATICDDQAELLRNLQVAAGAVLPSTGARAASPGSTVPLHVGNRTIVGEIVAVARAGGVRPTRLAHGVPLGGELEYVDRSTLAHAFGSRQLLD